MEPALQLIEVGLHDAGSGVVIRMVCGDCDVVCVGVEVDVIGSGWEVVKIEVEKRRGQDRALGNAVWNVFGSGCLALCVYVGGSTG